MEKKSALVTGGATGIGLATVKEFVSHGMKVIVITPDWEDRSELVSLFPSVHTLTADLSDPQDLSAAFDAIRSQCCEHLDVLVNNAAIYERRSFDELDLEVWERTIRTNLTAPFLCAQQFRSFVKPKSHSYLINVVSDAYYVGPSLGAHYAASKGGLVSLTRCLARIFGSSASVLAVSPGVTRTRQSMIQEDKFDELATILPLNRIAEPADIAKAIVALTSGAFDYMTGAVVHLNGGRDMR